MLLTVVVPLAGTPGPASALAVSARAMSTRAAGGGNVDRVDPFIGTTGASDTEYGGMIPSTAPPFGMTRWSPMTRQNKVSVLPYRLGDPKITGFIGTHQPAIWMGDSGYVAGMPGVGEVKTAERDRGLPYSHRDETASPEQYAVDMHPSPGQTLRARLTATSRVGFLRLTYPKGAAANFVVQATRSGVTGNVHIDPARREITGYNPDRQDSGLGPFKAPHFKGYFVARFDTSFAGHGTANGAVRHDGQSDRTGPDVAGYVRFPAGAVTVTVRIATSFISVAQARANLDAEIPDGRSFDQTVAQVRAAWAAKLDRIRVQGGTRPQLTTLYTALYHALQYPSEMSEGGRYYSAYDDKVHRGISYTGYSLWDTFRAENALLILLAPERVNGMVTSMLQDYREGGWLPVWKNLTETNIMVGTNADSVIAEDIAKGFRGFDLNLAYQAVRKDAMTPPDYDTLLPYFDREPFAPVQARAGLTAYKKNGWVAADHSYAAGSRTLDYAYEDYAVAQVAKAAGKTSDAAYFLNRSKNYRKLYNRATGFMQARNRDGSWAPDGWVEGDQWAYTADVLHDIPGLIRLKGGNAAFAAWLDDHFGGGHNDPTNEPSHHIPYLYDYAGQPWKTQHLVRKIAATGFHTAPDGLPGNDDCGQMSAWYVFSALGFYPVNPASGRYAVSSPLFDKVTLDLPGSARPLVINAPGTATRPYIQGLKVNGRPVGRPFLAHTDLAHGGNLDFTMNQAPQRWGATTTPPPLNLALDRPATMINGTPAAQWGKPTANAVDGYPQTMAQSTGGAPWSLQVDLGRAASVGRVVVDPDWQNHPTAYDIKTSTNGTDWTTVARDPAAGGTTGCSAHGVKTCGQRRTYAFTPVKARYLRLEVHSWASAWTGTPLPWNGWALKELQAYSS
ncbi:GH92 family glycosyl hydrolase [Actinomadura oligospora]|uniref:GH92 family glycosyl hydrolase n=1 Tax=Actinomadura oligospora TaxID=111804 RepID=UPI0024805691|nr:GH92 family glycosyl hydrolase [Actinomadura oligospora]